MKMRLTGQEETRVQKRRPKKKACFENAHNKGNRMKSSMTSFPYDTDVQKHIYMMFTILLKPHQQFAPERYFRPT